MGLPRYDIRSDPINTLMETLSDPWIVKKPGTTIAAPTKASSFTQSRFRLSFTIILTFLILFTK